MPAEDAVSVSMKDLLRCVYVVVDGVTGCVCEAWDAVA